MLASGQAAQEDYISAEDGGTGHLGEPEVLCLVGAWVSICVLQGHEGHGHSMRGFNILPVLCSWHHSEKHLDVLACSLASRLMK